jgi:hypothetical protein
VTNWVFWYKEPQPAISISEEGAAAILRIEDPAGEMRVFRFPVKRLQ